MAFQYSRSELLSDINGGIRGKIGMIASQEDFINRVVREVNNDIAIRSTRRKSDLSPDMYPEVYQYSCPTDLRDSRIIDIPAQAKRHDGSFGLIPSEQFATNPQSGDIAIDDYNGVRTLLVKSSVTTTSVVIDEIEDSSQWTAVGDATNIHDDSDDYIVGSGSVAFDIGAGATTTAGITNANIESFDITEFLGGHSSIFVWAKIASTTDITNFVLRIGNDSGNYYAKTITTRHDGNAFQTGWNLLRFPLTSLSETGSVTDTTIGYASLYMTKTAGKINETDYKFNRLTIAEGVIHQVVYYSKYPWVSTAGVYIEKSTDGSDLLVADTSEYDLFVKKGIALGMRQTNFNGEEVIQADNDYEKAKAIYGFQNPDESQLMVSTYYRHG